MCDIPWEVDDVEIEGTWAKTWSGDYFLLHQDNDWGILLFATPENLEGLSRCTDVFSKFAKFFGIVRYFFQ
jgi:hypothetical protein